MRIKVIHTKTDATEQALQVLRQKRCQHAIEILDHDGFDSMGPTSDLWDLYLICREENGEMMVIQYHREEWFFDRTTLGSVYQMEKEKPVSLCEFVRHRPWLLLQADDFNETRDLKERIGL
jgi:hypothetical protein